jgi:hypothetical protein
LGLSGINVPTMPAARGAIRAPSQCETMAWSPQMRLNDKLRAAVFARDKGICAFSGLSLWVLDYGTAPFWHMDWADHVRPISRGGVNAIDNLVCASAFYNHKKRNNTNDQSYLFRDGAPTETFYWTHGDLSAEQMDTLARHACLTESDWYFNRALCNVLLALDVDWKAANVARKPKYWLDAAQRHLVAWRRSSGGVGDKSFLQRRLVRYPKAPDVRLMLALAAPEEPHLSDLFELLARHYRANADTLLRFTEAADAAGRKAALDHAAMTRDATEPLLAVLKRNLTRLDHLDSVRQPLPAVQR